MTPGGGEFDKLHQSHFWSIVLILFILLAKAIVIHWNHTNAALATGVSQCLCYKMKSELSPGALLLLLEAD